MDHLPSVSVVITTFNRINMLKECLDSLADQNYPSEKTEVVVVNDGSTDQTKEMLDSFRKKASFDLKVINQENMGYIKAAIEGVKHAGREILCFTGDDCVCDKNWIKNLTQGYVDQNVGAVGGKITERLDFMSD